MRTTLDLDSDVLDVARSLARAKRLSLGQVISDLARRGLAVDRIPARRKNGFPVVSLPAGSPSITDEAVKRAADQ